MATVKPERSKDFSIPRTRGTRIGKSFVTGFVKVAIGAAALAYILIKYWEPANGAVGIKKLLSLTPNYGYLAAIVLLAATVVTCQIVRWYLLVRALDLPFTIRNAFRLGFVGLFFNTLLPGSVGGDLVKAFFICREHPERKTRAVATVIVDRMLGLFGLLLFASSIGGALWMAGDTRIAENSYLRTIVLSCTTLVGLAVMGWIVLGFTPAARIERIGIGLLRWKWIGVTLSEMWGAVVLYRRRPKLLYLTIPITAFAQTLMIIYLHLAVRVYPLESVGTFAEHCIIGPIGFIAQAFFPAPGGVGGAEAIFGYLYTLIDRPESTGGIGRLTMRVADIGLGVLGYIVYLSMKAELPIAEAEKASEPAAA